MFPSSKGFLIVGVTTQRSDKVYKAPIVFGEKSVAAIDKKRGLIYVLLGSKTVI